MYFCFLYSENHLNVVLTVAVMKGVFAGRISEPEAGGGRMYLPEVGCCRGCEQGPPYLAIKRQLQPPTLEDPVYFLQKVRPDIDGNMAEEQTFEEEIWFVSNWKQSQHSIHQS